jgi:hypothetical protein
MKPLMRMMDTELKNGMDRIKFMVKLGLLEILLGVLLTLKEERLHFGEMINA